MEKIFVPLSVPNLKGNELKYVKKAIETEWVSTAGPYIEDFERNISEYVGAEGAVSCQNGTSGLHISLLLFGITGNDAVIVPSLTFIAAVNPVKYAGAEPIFMDCDDSLCLDPVKLKKYCEEECFFKDRKLISKKSGKHIKAIVVVHIFGNMADMASIMAIAEKYNLKVLEDATEALGTYYTDGEYKNKYAGTIGDAGVYSFNGNKIITTGGGGMIVSDNKEYLRKAKHLTTQAKYDPVYYIHDDIGYNYRMTNLQAALGLAQLEQLEKFIEIKNTNYTKYKNAFANCKGMRILDFNADIRSNKWFYSLYFNAGVNINELIDYLSERGVQTRQIWGIICEQKPYADAEAYKIEKSKHYWERIINLPCSTNLKDSDLNHVINTINKYCGEKYGI